MKLNLLTLVALLGYTATNFADAKVSRALTPKTYMGQIHAQQKAGHNCESIINRYRAEKSFNYGAISTQTTAWTDASFPTNEAIYWADPGYNSGRINQFASSTWKRAYTTLPNIKIYDPNSLVLGDIIQGALGDCYFLSPLSAIGEKASRLFSIFKTSKVNPAGIFSAQIYVRGVPVVYSVDDFLPFNAKTNRLVFNDQGRDGTIWATMMEKIWAKANGNYDNIIGGTTQDTFNAILGAPSYNYYLSDLGYVKGNSKTYAEAVAQSQALIENGLLYKFPMTAGTFETPNVYGLVIGHAHTIMSIHYLKNAKGVVTNILYKLKNPWGIDSYTGKWNDEDAINWTADFKKQVNFVNNVNDGVFFMENLDFIHAFESFTICYFYDNGKISTTEIFGDQLQKTYIQFDFNTQWDIYVGVDFYPQRMYPNTCRSGDSEGYLSIYTFNGDPIILNYVIWDTEPTNAILFDELEQGSYVAKIEMTYWDDNAVPDYTFKTYTNAACPQKLYQQADIKAFNTRLLQSNIIAGFGRTEKGNQVAYTQFVVNQGFVGGDTLMIELVIKPEFKTCRELVMIVSLVSVDNTKADIQTTPGTACSVGIAKGSYDCICNLSAGGSQRCVYAYFQAVSNKFNVQYKTQKC